MAKKIAKEYYLMHKDIPVCLMEILEDGSLGNYRINDSGNSMFYNIPYEQLGNVRIDDIKTHSFVEKEVRLLSCVQDRNVVDLDKADIDFGIYENDLVERHIRIPLLKELYEKKINKLNAFQRGKDIWKTQL